jgi:hypothetical protein
MKIATMLSAAAFVVALGLTTAQAQDPGGMNQGGPPAASPGGGGPGGRPTWDPAPAALRIWADQASPNRKAISPA